MHRYRITVQELGSENAADAQGRSLEFEAENHDDILAILEILRQKNVFDESSLPALAVGLKLFGGAMLKNKELPVFAEFMPRFVEFMKAFKKVG